MWVWGEYLAPNVSLYFQDQMHSFPTYCTMSFFSLRSNHIKDKAKAGNKISLNGWTPLAKGRAGTTAPKVVGQDFMFLMIFNQMWAIK